MMYATALFIHILGWAQWMSGQLAVAGMLRREPVVGGETGRRLKPALRGMWITLAIGVVLTIAGAVWLILINPGFMRQGFVHTKILLALAEIGIWLGPLRRAWRDLDGDGPALPGYWFAASLVGFLAMIALGAYKPF